MNSVQLTKLIKTSIYDKLKKSLNNCIFDSDLNKFLLTIYVNKGIKVKPFNYIESCELYLDKGSEGALLRNLFEESTKTIEKEFNKNRKLCRIFKDLYCNNASVLLDGILNEEIMYSLVKVFFLDDTTLERMELNKNSEDLKSLNSDKYLIGLLQKYVVCLIGVDILMNSDSDADLVSMAISADTDGFLDRVYMLIVDNYGCKNKN